jgi:hypothetical protein
MMPVAKELGNSAAIALKSYVSPEVFCNWESGSAAAEEAFGNASGFSSHFLECIHCDQSVGMEEFKDTDQSRNTSCGCDVSLTE